MKKILKTMSVLMCGLVMQTGFTACSGDDDDDNKPKEEQQQPADDQTSTQPQKRGNILDGTMAYSASCADLEALREISSDGKVYVKYFDADGTVKTEEFTGSFSKTVNLKLNKNNELLAGMMVYLNDIDMTKAQAVLCKKELRVRATGTAKLNYENAKNVVQACEPLANTAFPKAEESQLEEYLKNLEHYAQEDKKVYGVVVFSAFAISVKTDEMFESNNPWKLNQ